jgi:hypothetical protein
MTLIFIPKFGSPFFAGLQLALYGGLLLLFCLRKRIRYNWRAGLMLGLLWLSSAGKLFVSGPALDAEFLMGVVTLMIMLFLPATIGWAMVGLVALTIMAVGAFVMWGGWEFAIDYQQIIHQPISWFLSAYRVCLSSCIIAYVVWQMMSSLRVSLEQAQTKARQLEETQHIAKLGAWRYIPAQNRLIVSDEYCRLFDCEQTGTMNLETLLERVAPEDKQRVEDALHGILQTGKPYLMEYQIQSNGARLWILERVNCQIERGVIAEVFSVVQDVTELKHTEQALHETKTLIQSLSNNLASSMIYQVVRFKDGTRKFTYLSDAVRRLYGCSAQEAMDNPELIYRCVHEDDRKRVWLLEEEAYQSLSMFRTEARIVEPSGRIRWSAYVSTPRLLEHGATCWDGIEFDITERKTIEEKHRQSEERYRAIYVQSPIAIELYDGDGYLINVNPACMQMFGVTNAQELHGFNLFNDPNVDSQYKERLKNRETVRYQAFVDFEKVKQLNLYHTFKSGRLWLDTLITPIGGKSIDGYLVHVQNISESKQSDKALQESEARLVEAQQLAKIGCWELNFLTCQLLWSSEVYRIFEIDPQQFGASYEAFLAVVHPEDRELVNKIFKSSLAARQPYSIVHRLLMPDGRVKYAHERGETYYDSVGQPLRSVGTVQDVTEQKRAEEALNESRYFIESVLNTTPDFVYIYDLKERRNIYSNQEIANVLGYTPEQILQLGDKMLETLLHPDDIPLVTEHLRLMESIQDEPLEVEYRVRDKQGQCRWLHSREKAFLRNDNGSARQIIGVALDVTRRKRAEEALRKSEALFRLAFDNANIGMCLVDLQGRLTKVNPRFCKMFGYSEEELAGMSLIELTYPEDQQNSARFIQQMLCGPARQGEIENRYIDKQGRVVWGDVSSSLVQDEQGVPQYFIAHVRDITLRKQAEDALRESEAKLRAIFNAVTVPLALNDERQNITYLNPAFVRVFGYTMEDIPTLADWWPKAYPDPNYRQWVATSWQATLEKAKRKGVPFTPFELTIACKNGETKTVLASAASLGKSFVGEHLVVLYDITDRLRAELLLFESERKYRVTIEQAAIGIANIALDGRFLHVNTRLCEILGYTPRQMLTLTFQAITHPDDLELDQSYMRQALSGKIKSYAMEKRYFKKNGEVVWVNLSGALVRHANDMPNYFVSIIEDITERKRLEAALHESEILLQGFFEMPHAMSGIVETLQDDILHIRCNKSAASFLGYSQEFLKNKLASEIGMSSESIKMWIHYFEESRLTERPTTFEYLRTTPSGSRWLSPTVSYLGQRSGRHRFAYVVADITDRKLAEERIERFFNISSDLMCIASQDGYFKRINPAFTSTLGFTDEELLSRPFVGFTHPDDVEATLAEVKKLSLGLRTTHFENRYRCKDGSYKWLSWQAVYYQDDGFIYATARDTTERKEAEEQIKTSLREKEVLLREIHHRVKNNLTVVTSLIQMQSDETNEQRVIDLLQDLHNRVMAMAMVHEDLYQSKNLSQIYFRTYLERLAANIRQSFARACATIKVEVDDSCLDVQKSIPCGLIVAELLTNALKYAFRFPSDHSCQCCEIGVELRKSGQTYTLIVRDNGVGLPVELDWRSPRTLGLELVNIWATHQLKGTLDVDRERGTIFTITFTD